MFRTALFRTGLAASAALMFSACAPTSQADANYQTASGGDRDCFQTQNVNGFTVVDERHVRVRVGASRYYMLTTDWDTHGLDWDRNVALTTTGSFVCTGANTSELRIVGEGREFRVSGVERTTAPTPG